MTPATTQTQIPHVVDVDELRNQLADAQQTIAALSERIEQLDPADRPDTLDELLVGATALLRRVPKAIGPLELIGTGARSDVEQMTATALDALADARARLATPF